MTRADSSDLAGARQRLIEPPSLRSSLGTTKPRSTEMFTMYEALARERMREQHERSQRERVASGLATARRWHRRELHARAAERRHAQRADRAARASAVVEASWQ